MEYYRWIYITNAYAFAFSIIVRALHDFSDIIVSFGSPRYHYFLRADPRGDSSTFRREGVVEGDNVLI